MILIIIIVKEIILNLMIISNFYKDSELTKVAIGSNVVIQLLLNLKIIFYELYIYINIFLYLNYNFNEARLISPANDVSLDIEFYLYYIIKLNLYCINKFLILEAQL